VEQKGRLKQFPLSRGLPGLFLASERMHLVGLTVCAPRLNVRVDADAFPRVYSSLESLILGSSHCAEDTVPTSVLVLVTHIPITLGDRSPLPDMCFLVDDLAISAPLQDSRGGSSVRGTVSDSSGKLWCWCHLSGLVRYLLRFPLVQLCIVSAERSSWEMHRLCCMFIVHALLARQ
jgi:hypothetical protein